MDMRRKSGLFSANLRRIMRGIILKKVKKRGLRLAFRGLGVVSLQWILGREAEGLDRSDFYEYSDTFNTINTMTMLIMREMASGMRGAEGRLFPVFLERGRVALEELASEISSRCTLTVHDVKACVSALSEVVGEHLGRGDTVQMGELGTLHATLRLNPNISAETKEGVQHNANAFEVKRVHFTPNKHLLQTANDRLQQGAKRRRGTLRASTQKSSKAERLKRLQDYLRQHHTISYRNYALLVGLSPSTALRELQQWQRQSGTHVGKADGRTIWRA